MTEIGSVQSSGNGLLAMIPSLLTKSPEEVVRAIRENVPDREREILFLKLLNRSTGSRSEALRGARFVEPPEGGPRLDTLID